MKNFDRKVILLKAEATEGTDAAPVVGTNAFRVLDYSPTFMDADARPRNIEKAYFGADPVAMANFKRGASWTMEMHGGGAAGTVPQWMTVLAFAGFGAPVVVASTSATQSPTSTVSSATHWAYIDDLLLKTIGARMNAGYTVEDDQIPMFNMTLLGRPPTTLGEESAPGTAVFSGIVDPVIASSENTTFTLDGYAVPLRRMTMNANADLQFRSLIGPQDRVLYRDRNWNGSIVVELPNLATKDYFAKVRPGTTMASSLAHGNVAGNIVTITHPKLQITGNVELSEEQGAIMATFPVTALANAGNDEVVFAAT
jgi:hypothetical protein